MRFGFVVEKLAAPGCIDEIAGMVTTDIRQNMGVPDMNTESTECDRRLITPPRAIAGLCLVAPPVLVGCSHSPEYSIFGSFFPAWIFCSLGGLVLMAGTRAMIARTSIAEHLAAPVLFYLSMAMFLTSMLWLLFYS